MKVFLVLFLIHLSFPIHSQEKTQQLKATIIGSGSPKFNTQRSGPSVLISYKNTHILVDMGNGTQANLSKNNTKIKEIDGLLFTHHHLDHNEEFTPIFIQSLLGGNNIIVSGPEPTTKMITNILDIYKEDINYRLSKSGREITTATKKVISRDLTGNESFTIGDIKITSTPVKHTISTLAYRFEVGNQSIVISGDLTYSKTLPILAKNADYLIMDSGGAIKLGSKVRINKNSNNRKNTQKAHVNLAESSLMAKEANVKNLVLTHFNFTDIDEEATRKEIQKNYGGNIIFAYDLMKIPLLEDNIKKEISNLPEKPIQNKNRTSSFSNMLKNMDTNNDQKISKTEAKGKLKENFEKRDGDNDGFITENEMKQRIQ